MHIPACLIRQKTTIIIRLGLIPWLSLLKCLPDTKVVFTDTLVVLLTINQFCVSISSYVSKRYAFGLLEKEKAGPLDSVADIRIICS